MKGWTVIMIERALVVTNNKMAAQKMKDKHEIVFVKGTLIDVLKATRDYIHKGHKLLTHPLAGSVKPNETPYKTVLISMSNGETIDIESLDLIESSIQTSEKFISTKPTPCWSKEVLQDFMLIDYDLICSSIT